MERAFGRCEHCGKASKVLGPDPYCTNCEPELQAVKLRLLTGARRRARKAGVPFNLSHDDIRIPPRCPVLDIKLVTGTGVSTDASPSLDRIIPASGYVPGNVIVVSHLANRIKSSATPDQIKRVASFYELIEWHEEHQPRSRPS